jgi:hypothetical protein
MVHLHETFFRRASEPSEVPHGVAS